jgi:hypothetical protein
MDADHLQDRLYWGLNRMANKIGQVTDAYRANGTSDPLDRSNRFLQLHAAFSRVDGNFAQPVGYEVAVWRGYFDASYTRIGDFLVRAPDIWFIAAQHSLLPILCIKANRVISVTRQVIPAASTSTGTTVVASSINVISRWPASVLGTGTEGRPVTQLPGDTRIPNAIALLPSTHGQVLQPADVVTDDLGTTSIVVAAELTDLGWRLNVRAVTT